MLTGVEMKIILSLLLVALAGCAHTSGRIAVLQNQETKQTVECRVDPMGSMNYDRQVDNCITIYQKAGYKLVADSADPN